MPKLKSLALCALALLPMATISQTQTPPTAQTETANDHQAEQAAIEQVMKQYHAAIQLLGLNLSRPAESRATRTSS